MQFCRTITTMSQTTKLKDIVPSSEKYKVFGRLIRLWDARYATSNALVSIDGILLDDEVYLLTTFAL